MLGAFAHVVDVMNMYALCGNKCVDKMWRSEVYVWCPPLLLTNISWSRDSWNPSFLILLIRIVSLTEKSCLNVLRVRIVKGLQTPCSFVMSAKDLNLNHHSQAMDILLQNVALTQDHCRFLKNILINIIVMIIIDWWLYLNVDMAYWSNRPSY